jgi:hypothetical protein
VHIWKDTEKSVYDYFEKVQVPTWNWQGLYNSVKRSLAKLKRCNSNLKYGLLLSRCASKVEPYIADQYVINNFPEAFRSSLLAHNFKTSRYWALVQEAPLEISY